MTFDNYFDTFAALGGAFLSFFLGGLDGLMKLLVVFVIVDYVTGVMKGFVEHRFSSDIGFHGIARKVCMFLVVGIANVIDHEMLGHTEVLRDAVVMFYVANEGLSITENAIALGVPFPDSLKERFLSWQNKKLTSKNEPDIYDAD